MIVYDYCSGWLERDNRKGLQPGQTWYLVAMQWWRAWLEYIYCDVSTWTKHNENLYLISMNFDFSPLKIVSLVTEHIF